MKDYIFNFEAEVFNGVSQASHISSAIVKQSHNWTSTKKKINNNNIRTKKPKKHSKP